MLVATATAANAGNTLNAKVGNAPSTRVEMEMNTAMETRRTAASRGVCLSIMPAV